MNRFSLLFVSVALVVTSVSLNAEDPPSIKNILFNSEELYDMRTDPGQFTNLAEHPDHAATVKRLAAGLRACLERARLTFK